MVSAATGKKKNSLYEWIANAVEKHNFYKKRRSEVTQFMPTMLAQFPKIHILEERLDALDGSEDCPVEEVAALLGEVVRLKMETRPNQHTKRIEKVESLGRHLLGHLDEVEKGNADLQMQDFKHYDLVVANLMQLQPENSEYPRKALQCRKLRQMVGTVNLKKDVIAKAELLSADLTSAVVHAEFAALASLMQGVDLSESKDAVEKVGRAVLRQVKDGVLNGSEEAFVATTLDVFEIVASAGGLPEVACTMHCKAKEISASKALNKVKQMGGTVADIVSLSTSAAAIEVLRLKAQELFRYITQCSKEKVMLLNEALETDTFEECKKFLGELSSFELNQADEKMKAAAKKLHPTIGVADVSYKMKWADGVDSFKDLAIAAEKVLAVEATLKKLTEEYNQVLRLVVFFSSN